MSYHAYNGNGAHIERGAFDGIANDDDAVAALRRLVQEYPATWSLWHVSRGRGRIVAVAGAGEWLVMMDEAIRATLPLPEDRPRRIRREGDEP